MRFLFIPSTAISLYDRIVDDRAIGGTETGVVRLAQELMKLGNEVTVVTSHPNPPLSDPLYLPFNQVGNIGSTDIAIALRDFNPFFWNIEARKKFYWTGDSYDQPVTIGLGDKRIVDKIDGFLAVSKWQAETMSNASGFPESKTFVIGNGIHTPYFSGVGKRQRQRMIYSSTPYRGLDHLLRLFPHIKEKVPNAELCICSGLDVYARSIGTIPDGYQKEQLRLKKMREIAEKMPGVLFIGSTKQSELSIQFECASVLSYPNIFEETSCITAMEAMACGCVPITSNKGALPETIGDCGILIDGNPGSPEYDKHFVDECVSLLSDDQRFNRLSMLGIARKDELSWATVAKKLISICT